MNSAVLPETQQAPANPGRGSAVPKHVARHLVSGTSALGLSVLIERGMGFLANILAARFGGASTFGNYSLAITTANNISTYAAGGIGATAARFSGKYPRGSAGYRSLGRALLIVSLVSACAAVAALWFGARPLAHLLQKDSLTYILRWAAFSAAGIILLECARGFFVGQRFLFALVLLSSLVGVGMVALLPVAALRHQPTHMIISQGAITTGAVLVCLLLARPLGLTAAANASPVRSTSVGPILKEVWSFGLVQLASLIGANISGWWLASLVARADTSLVQMGFFSVASQLRNIVGLAPSLLTESSYAVMAEREGEEARTPDQVMAVCTYLSTLVSFSLAALGILIVPWGLTLLYGRAFSGAASTTALALAIAVVHMGNSPAAARMTIVSIKISGIINTAWAVFVALAGTVFMLQGGSAWKAMAIYLAAHVLSSALVLIVLIRRDCVPHGVIPVFFLSTVSITALAAISFFRDLQPSSALPASGLMLLIVVASMAALISLGRRHRWLPDAETAIRLGSIVFGRVRSVLGRKGSHAA